IMAILMTGFMSGEEIDLKKYRLVDIRKLEKLQKDLERIRKALEILMKE
ncbi:unnamed protein product, partial [marine sediment metagenome]